MDSTADSCWLNWTAIPDEDINGESVSYEVYVVKNESAYQSLDGEPSITVLACGNTTEANVTMLDVFTAYSIKVAFRNNIGAGNYSDTVECITGEGGKVWFFCLILFIAASEHEVKIKAVFGNQFPILITSTRLMRAVENCSQRLNRLTFAGSTTLRE